MKGQAEPAPLTPQMLDAGARMDRSLQLSDPSDREQARALYAIMAPSSHRLTRTMIKVGAESLTLSQSQGLSTEEKLIALYRAMEARRAR